jgi:hypothetical protein
MEEIIRKEMPFIRWMAKVTERLNIVQLSIKEKIEIREEDWEIIKLLHRQHNIGALPIYENIVINKDESSQSVTQANLFSADVSSTAVVDSNGTDIEPPKAETIKKKKK